MELYRRHVIDYTYCTTSLTLSQGIFGNDARDMKRSATIRDVAQAAQVSTATVSRVLSTPQLVAPDTREMVLKAIRQTGYRVNQAARNLRMKRAGAVLVLVPNLGKPFYSEILAGVSEAFADSDYAVLISDTENRPSRTPDLGSYFMDGRIDGAISLDGGLNRAALAECRTLGVAEKIVFLCEWVAGEDFPVIASDNAEGARLAVRHLHELGHRRIAHVTGPEGNVLTATRRDGMIEERARLGLPARSDLIIRGDFSLESGRAAAATILAMERPPTAVFCAADMVAFGLISALHDRGMRVPQDISVVGFDDIEMSECFVPTLTTIRQNRKALGRRAGAVLLDRLSGRIEPRGPEPLEPVELIRRGSTGPAPAHGAPNTA